MPKPGVGVMDILAGVAGISVAGYAVAVVSGLALPATAIFGGFVGVLYVTAPARKFPTGEDVTDGIDLTGKVALVTGATSGIGVETARVLALRGAHVYLAGRNSKKLEATMKGLRESLPESAKVDTLTCDLGDLQSVKQCATDFLAVQKQLHILVNNAGIMALPERKMTVQGLEQQVGICHVGHFYLTKLLLPALQSADGARVVCLSSSAHGYHDMAKCLKSEKLDTDPYIDWEAYGNAKCANMLHAKALQSKYSPQITSFSVMPGGIHTGLQDHVDWWVKVKYAVVTPFFFKTVPQGAATSLVCATKADPAEGGEYFDNCKVKPAALEKVLKVVGDDAPERLWEATEKLLKVLDFN